MTLSHTIINDTMTRDRGPTTPEIKDFFWGIDLPTVLPQLESVLEIGAGKANTVRQMVKDFGVTGHALDLQDFRDPCDLGENDLDYIIGTAEAVPLKSGSIGFVFAYNVFRYVPDMLKGLSEVHRVLKQGGHAYLDFGFIEVGMHKKPIFPEIDQIISAYPNKGQLSVATTCIRYYNRQSGATGNIICDRLHIHKTDKRQLSLPILVSAGPYNSDLFMTPSVYAMKSDTI